MELTVVFSYKDTNTVGQGGCTQLTNKVTNKQRTAEKQATWDALKRDHSTHFSFYGSTVYVSETNGTEGTAYPLGTLQHPVDNMDDAYKIAERYGLYYINVFERSYSQTYTHFLS
jgi:hypothetical protein